MLVVLAIIALLLGLLTPVLRGARNQARRVLCAGHLSQLGQAFHMYAWEYQGRAMPLAYVDRTLIGTGPERFWWGVNDEHGVDHTQGFVWPYLRSELRNNSVYECPNQPWGSYRPQGHAQAVTSTYGYNAYYLSPPHATWWSNFIGHRPWQNVDTMPLPQRVFVFADALLDMSGPRPHNAVLLDPPFLYAGNHRWSRNDYPTTAFRHEGRTNAALADGHVETFGLRGGRIAAPRFQIGSVGSRNDPHYVPDCRDW